MDKAQAGHPDDLDSEFQNYKELSLFFLSAGVMWKALKAFDFKVVEKTVVYTLMLLQIIILHYFWC